MHSVTKIVHASLDLATTLDAVAQGVVDAAGFGVAAVNLKRPDGAFEVVSVAGDEQARELLLGGRRSIEGWQELLAQSERLGGLHLIDHRRASPALEECYSWVPDAASADDDEDAWHPLDALFARLTAPDGEWIGVLSVDLPAGGRRPGPVQLEVLELFADQAAIAITHARLHAALRASEAEARHAATHDPLTGLANRALLAEAAQRVCGGAGDDVAALLLDLDAFKAINDTHGHQAGDEVLRAVADRLRACVRDGDVVARTGGDEFVVLCSGQGAGAAAEGVAARLRDALTEPVTTSTGAHVVGASVGLARLPTPVSPSELLARADAAMYEDKRVRRSAEPGPDPGRGQRSIMRAIASG